MMHHFTQFFLCDVFLTGPNISDFDICCNKNLWINSLISYTVCMKQGVSNLLYMVFIAEI